MSAVDPKQAGMAHRGEGDDLAPEQKGNSPDYNQLNNLSYEINW